MLSIYFKQKVYMQSIQPFKPELKSHQTDAIIVSCSTSCFPLQWAKWEHTKGAILCSLHWWCKYTGCDFCWSHLHLTYFYIFSLHHSLFCRCKEQEKQTKGALKKSRMFQKKKVPLELFQAIAQSLNDVCVCQIHISRTKYMPKYVLYK